MTFLETWHHYLGHPPDFKNIWLEGKSRLDGVALAIIKDDLPALTSMGWSDTKRVFESETSILKNLSKQFSSIFAFPVFPEKFTFYFKINVSTYIYISSLNDINIYNESVQSSLLRACIGGDVKNVTFNFFF